MTPILDEATPEKDLGSEATGSGPRTRCSAEQTAGDESHAATRREADATFVSDMVQMLRRIDGRVALLESKLRGIESRERDAASSREADREELEVHRAALARFQHWVGPNGQNGRSG
jgi:hypothetical protein